MTRTPTGYSGTPLVKKLGVKTGMRVSFVNAPEGYASILGPLPDGVCEPADAADLDFVQLFTLSRGELECGAPAAEGHTESRWDALGLLAQAGLEGRDGPNRERRP